MDNDALAKIVAEIEETIDDKIFYCFEIAERGIGFRRNDMVKEWVTSASLYMSYKISKEIGQIIKHIDPKDSQNKTFAVKLDGMIDKFLKENTNLKHSIENYCKDRDELKPVLIGFRAAWESLQNVQEGLETLI